MSCILWGWKAIRLLQTFRESWSVPFSSLAISRGYTSGIEERWVSVGIWQKKFSSLAIELCQYFVILELFENHSQVPFSSFCYLERIQFWYNGEVSWFLDLAIELCQYFVSLELFKKHSQAPLFESCYPERIQFWNRG